MSELSDYRRLVEKPMQESNAATIKALRDRIEALEADLKMLIGLDVTAREGQRAFAEWRNKFEKESRK